MVHFTHVWSEFLNLFCYSYMKILHLIDHLNSEHNYILQFSDYTSFLSRKDEEEKKTYSNYMYNTQLHRCFLTSNTGIFTATVRENTILR